MVKITIVSALIFISMGAFGEESVLPTDDNCQLAKEKAKLILKDEIAFAATNSKREELEELLSRKELIQKNHQINCLLNKSPLSDTDQEQLVKLTAQQKEAIKPEIKKEQNTADSHVIAAFEFGTMWLPDYSDDTNGGFSENRAYFDSYFDGRYDFADAPDKDDGLNLLINAGFIGTFYGSGTNVEPESVDDNGVIAMSDQSSNTGFPTDFNQVSDTFDGSFTLRASASYCNKETTLSKLACVLTSENKRSNLGIIYRYGFQNRDKRLENSDTVNRYKGWGLDYRYYRSDILAGRNAIPDVIITYLHNAKFEEYGARVSTEACTEGNTSCLVPIENAKRKLLLFNWRIVKDKPYFFGFRLNAGEGQDDYGVTLGIRKNGTDLLSFFGIE
ncbi:hypothetical protein [Planctobacterium marinum]|uniref:hypothetical protein n=1 Tax=Planctobacterium marinum TaxID=1631968 RepID=UPI001E38E6CA|nr:hypothetical protein [Planctobacterium marinum]MCC2608063.1 hypothetical protein [Planctobacterium marinum]